MTGRTREYFNQFNTGQLQRQITVRNYDDLVNAITTLIRNYSALTNSLPYLGYEIIIADSIIFPRKIILPVEVSGVTIRSLGRVQVLPHNDGNVDCAFDIQGARSVVIKDLFVGSIGTYFTDFVKVSSFTSGLDFDGPVVTNNVVNVICVYRDTTANANSAVISYNTHRTPDGGDFTIFTQATMCRVIGNNFGPDDAEISGARSKIIGNDFNSAILTTAGDGSTYLYGNSRVTLDSGTDPYVLDELGNHVLPKASGTGVKVDLENPTFPWFDLLGEIYPKTSGAGTPTLSTFRGGQVQTYAWTTNDIGDIIWHIPHDYVPNSDIFIHIHWAHNGTAISGNLVVDYHFTYAKGHGQEIFPAEKNITQTISTPNIATIPRYSHRIDEVQMSAVSPAANQIDSNDIEPDGIILLRMITTTIPTITGGSPNEPYIFFCDIHYQSTGVGTKQKSPDFWT